MRSPWKAGETVLKSSFATQNLSEHHKMGQRFMIGVDSTRLDDELKYAIDRLNIGGLILFARNLQSPEQMESFCRDAQAYAAGCGLPPLFIAIDQEGGQVARLKPPFTQFKGNPHMKSTEDAAAFARITATELRNIGVNMNMAPVLDVLPPKGPSVMEKRSFGRDPQWVARMGATVISHLQDNGVMAVAKHFPGIGRTVLDSHEDLPDLELSQVQMEAADLIPFAAAARIPVSGIMLSHIRYLQLDPVWPASLSARIAADLLRRQIGYRGLVLTDDLDMGAIAKHYDIATIVNQCLSAEIDIMLICHAGPKIKAAYDHAIALYCRNEDLQRMAGESLARIMDQKQRYLMEKS
jgi:beta-N-acetylhexosaminidase